jgi:pyridoxal 5'-phosphate synthase pdxT subunit
MNVCWPPLARSGGGARFSAPARGHPAGRRVSHPAQESLGLMDIDVERNAYGRQIDSRVAHFTPEAEFAARTYPGEMEAVFIRAPVIRRVGPQARVLARYAGDPVLVVQGRHLAATFHPELTADSRVHEFFLSKL